MKPILLLLACSAVLLSAAELSAVHSVYILPMSRGLDQYLANRLTNDGVLQVVTDAKRADAFFTDRIGESFEAQVEALLPAPPPPAPPEKDGKKADSPNELPAPTETMNKLSNPALNSNMGRAKGTVFLVDAKSRQVLWSTFEPGRGVASKDMDRTAANIVDRFKKAVNPAHK